MPEYESDEAGTEPAAIREYARIQTFPDDWQFAGSVSSKYKQIGNAVPVNLAFAVARAALRSFNQIVEKDLSPALKAPPSFVYSACRDLPLLEHLAEMRADSKTSRHIM